MDIQHYTVFLIPTDSKCLPYMTEMMTFPIPPSFPNKSPPFRAGLHPYPELLMQYAQTNSTSVPWRFHVRYKSHYNITYEHCVVTNGQTK